ncbi:hypothetical protein DSO57_1018564 [Entomophthora muscae]|uniref:Uncharacterized protein n=1 Tax=Entomophthora muscae TaxID=34485 RepID=A0ACC2TF92_9FUNG|nr:hypothetical protein DSO57_1018564 [Entomophthora muscae]
MVPLFFIALLATTLASPVATGRFTEPEQAAIDARIKEMVVHAGGESAPVTKQSDDEPIIESVGINPKYDGTHLIKLWTFPPRLN